VDDIPSPVFEYYPLAKFCNGVMNALNDLGEYAPYAAADEITKCLHTTLHNASCALFSMYYQKDFKCYDEVRITVLHDVYLSLIYSVT